MFLHPDDPPVADSRSLQRFEFESDGALLTGVRLFSPESNTVILYMSGNQFRVAIEGGAVVRALPGDVDVILFDYPGYGASAGEASAATMGQAALGLFDHALESAWLRDRNVVVYGLSLGGFVAANLVAERPVNGVILESTATTIQDWADSLVPVIARPFVDVQVASSLHTFDNVERLTRAGVPVLIVAAGKDTQTKPVLMRKLFKQLQQQEVRVTYREASKADHGGASEDADFKLWVRSFLDSLPRN